MKKRDLSLEEANMLAANGAAFLDCKLGKCGPNIADRKKTGPSLLLLGLSR